MNTHELLELAALDALGLLEDDERDAFDKAFRAAAPALQAQVRREQTRIARDESMLPEVSPPIGLRARVLAAWREAVQSLTAHPSGARRHGAGRFVPPLLPSRGVTPIWRAVAIGCAAASIVLGFATYAMEAEFKKVASASRDNFISEAWQRDFGPGFERDLFNKSSTLVHLTPVASDAPEFKGQACIVLDRERKAGTLYCRDLPADGQEYKLVLVDKDGRVVKDTKLTCVIRTSDDTGTKFRQKMQEIPLSSGMSLAVIAAGSSSESPKFLLRTGNL